MGAKPHLAETPVGRQSKDGYLDSDDGKPNKEKTLDYEKNANQADMYESYDFNPYEPAFTKPAKSKEEQNARVMTDKQLADEVAWIKRNKETDEEISDFLADALLEMQMSTAMVRQVIKEIVSVRCYPLQMNEYLSHMLEEGERLGR